MALPTTSGELVKTFSKNQRAPANLRAKSAVPVARAGRMDEARVSRVREFLSHHTRTHTHTHFFFCCCLPIDSASHNPTQMVLLTESASFLAFAPLTSGVTAVARKLKRATVKEAQSRPAKPVPASSFTPIRPGRRIRCRGE